jgi:large subunit ribosomal protein L30
VKIKVTQTRSQIGHQEKHKLIVKALGLGKIGKSRIHDDNPVIRGMINKVIYMVKVETVNADDSSAE